MAQSGPIDLNKYLNTLLQVEEKKKMQSSFDIMQKLMKRKVLNNT
jgi:hypothetical protein